MVLKNHNYLMHDIEYISPTARLLIRGMGCCKLQNNFIICFEVQVYVLNIVLKKTEHKITLLNRKKRRMKFLLFGRDYRVSFQVAYTLKKYI